MVDSIKLPPRVRIRIGDDQTGSYPTISRTGDVDRSGRYSVMFDDTVQVPFSQGILVNFPSLLPSGSQFIAGQTSSLSVVSDTVKGISDTFVTFKAPGQLISPFDASRYPEQTSTAADQSNDPFYMTGSSLKAVGPGFSSRLASKTRVTIDLTPSVSNTFVERTTNFVPPDASNAVTAAGRSYPVQYFNHQLKQWEGVFQGNPHDILLGTFQNMSATLSGFGTSLDIYGAAGVGSGSLNAAQPYSTWGFPFAAKYHATSSQLLSLSDYLSAPFVLEKIVYEFSGTLVNCATGTMWTPDLIDANASPVGNLPNYFIPITTFFILNQREPFPSRVEYQIQNAFFGQTLSASFLHQLPSDISLTNGAATTRVNSTRDLVLFAQVSGLDRGAGVTAAASVTFVSGVNAIASRDLNIYANTTGSREVCWTGKYSLSASCRAPNTNPALGVKDGGSLFNPGQFGEAVYVDWKYGGRMGTGQTTGRSLVSDVGGAVPLNGSFTWFSAPLATFSSQSRVDPYILFPTDKLVFGWEIPNGGLHPLTDPGYSLTIHAGVGRLVLYGSLLQLGSEYHNTVNQSLTSPSVHEIIGAEDTALDSVLDQFDVEARQQFSGSYLGVYLTGTLADGQPRHIIASTVAKNSIGGNFPSLNDRDQSVLATVPGFCRGVQLVSENERYFDTMMPSIEDIIHADGVLISKHGASNQVIFGRDSTLETPLGGSNTFQVDPTWNLAFPFEARYSAAKRLLNGLDRVTSDVELLGATPVKPVIRPFQVVRQVPVSDIIAPSFDFQIVYLVNASNNDAFATNNEMLMHVYGIGDWYSGSVHYGVKTTNAFDNTIVYGTIARGFKYGVKNALPQFTKAIFRRDTFGQFRDMLEPRDISKFFDVIGLNPDGTLSGRTAVTASPVSVRFVEPRSTINTQATRTWSSNLDTEATSSVPYFDGLVRNRETPLNTSQLNSVTVTL